MIRLSKQTDYGIILLTRFAQDPQGLTYSARELAEETRLPFPMVSKILKVLAREGLLDSHRGPRGGYSLTRRPDLISVADVISAMEGPIAITECVDAPGDCRQEPICPVRSNWRRINVLVHQALESISLSDMTRPLPDHLVTLRGLEGEPGHPGVGQTEGGAGASLPMTETMGGPRLMSE